MTDDSRDEDELVPWGPSSLFGKIAVFVGMVLTVVVIAGRGLATGWFVFRDGLPPEWTMPYIVTVVYTSLTVVGLVGLAAAIVYLVARRMQDQREVDRIMAESEAASKFEEASTTPYGDGLDEESVTDSEETVVAFDEAAAEDGGEDDGDAADDG